MALARKIFKSSVIITSGEIVAQVCSLLRNVILARVLTKADFGVAAILGMTISIFEIGGRLSIENCLVQSKDGDKPRFMAAAHALQAMLGLVSCLLIFATAYPMAAYFKAPEAAWALQLLSVVPLIRSLAHLDLYRMTRELRFGPGVLSDIVPQLIITLAVWPLTLIWKSYVVLVWLLVGKQLASTIASHFLAKRPYQWAYDREINASLLHFGWPMLINGLLLFGIMQGDRFAIGIKYTVAELGVYAVAGSLTLVPAATLLKLSGSISLPLLSSAKDDEPLFIRMQATTSQVLALFSAIYAVVMILSGGPLVRLVFGAKYGDAAALTAWLGFSQALRLLRCMPTVAAMAKGDSKNLMYSNLFRLSGLALAFPLAMAGVSLVTIASCSAVGELVAMIGSFWRFSRNHRIPANTFLPAFSLAAVFIGLSAGLFLLGLPNLTMWIPLLVTTLLVVAIVVAYLALFGESRRLMLSKLAPKIPFLLRFAG